MEIVSASTNIETTATGAMAMIRFNTEAHTPASATAICTGVVRRFSDRQPVTRWTVTIVTDLGITRTGTTEVSSMCMDTTQDAFRALNRFANSCSTLEPERAAVMTRVTGDNPQPRTNFVSAL